MYANKRANITRWRTFAMADRPQVLIDYMPDVFIMRIGVLILQLSENNYILGDLLNVDVFCKK